MEEKGTELIHAFDSLFTTNKIQMLKILLSRLSPSSQGSLAVYIKFLELQYTISFFRAHPSVKLPGQKKPLSLNLMDSDNTDTVELLDELLPFSSPDERKKIQTLKSMLSNMSHMKEMMDMIQMMQELFPDGFEGAGANPADLLSGLSGMGNMDMSSLFQMFGENKENK